MGTPRSKLKEFEKALLEDGWNQIREQVEVKLVTLPGGTETYVLCRSTARREKEKAIRRRFSERLEQALGRLHQRVAQGRLKDRTKIQQALASLRARHPRVADLYQMSVVEREGTLHVEWQLMEERRAWREAREGA